VLLDSIYLDGNFVSYAFTPRFLFSAIKDKRNVISARHPLTQDFASDCGGDPIRRSDHGFNF